MQDKPIVSYRPSLPSSLPMAVLCRHHQPSEPRQHAVADLGEPGRASEVEGCEGGLVGVDAAEVVEIGHLVADHSPRPA